MGRRYQQTRTQVSCMELLPPWGGQTWPTEEPLSRRKCQCQRSPVTWEPTHHCLPPHLVTPIPSELERSACRQHLLPLPPPPGSAGTGVSLLLTTMRLSPILTRALGSSASCSPASAWLGDHGLMASSNHRIMESCRLEKNL